MKLGKDLFYLYDEHHKKMISVEYCSDCGNKYYFYGIAKTIFETIREKKTAKEVIDFKERHNLFYDEEIEGQRTLDDFLS